MPGLFALSALLLALAPDAGTAGELTLFDRDGKATRRITHIDRPGLLGAWEAGTFLALESGGMRLVERDLAGGVRWTHERPRGSPPVLSAAPAPGGTLLLSVGRGGVKEIDRAGRVVWEAPSPLRDAPVVSAVRLSDGSTLAAVWNRRHRLFRFPPGASRAEEVTSLPLPLNGPALRLVATKADGSEVLLFEPIWYELWRLVLERGALRVVERIDTRKIEPSRWIEEVVPDGTGGFAYIAEGFAVGRVSPDAPLIRFQTLFPPDGIFPAPDGRLLVAFTRVPDLSWPEERPKKEENPALRMWVLAVWLIGGLVAAAALFFLRREEREDEATGASARSGLGLRPGFAMRLGVALVVVGSALVAVVPWNESHRGGLWLAVLAILFSLVFLSKKSPGGSRAPGLLIPSKKSPGALGPPVLQSKDFLWVLPPLLIGCATIGYRLASIPVNTHFDYTYYALSAWDLMQGRCAGLWQFGFVPAPVFGLLPEVLGLTLFGPGPMGFRSGAALVGLSGILAVFILGTAYRDRRTGFLAALFLAGGIPWIHFSRMASTGEAAAVALWTLAFFALAVRTGRSAAFLMAGACAGLSFYFWPAARSGFAACLVAGAILAVRSPTAAWRNRRGAAMMALALAAFLAPLVRIWASGTDSAMPRAAESMTVWRPGEDVHWSVVASSFGRPLLESAGWFFRPADNSTHGTVGPACNGVEAALLVAGLLLAVTEGLSLNLLLLAQLGITLLVFGAWATSPPWSPRLLAAYPVAAILMARAVVAAADFAGRLSPRIRTISFAVAAAAILVLSPVRNFERYLRWETGHDGRGLTEMTAIGRRLEALGPSWHAWLVTTKRPEWSLDLAPRSAALGELLPFIWNRHVSEIRDLPARLPLPAGERAAVVVQNERLDEDVAVLRAAYPGARVEEITGLRGERLAGLVLVER